MSTIRDVAKEAGVSIATVSHILNNDEHYRVSEETRKKVFAACEKLQYSVKPAYSKRRRAKGGIAVMNNLTIEYQQDSYYLEILSNARAYFSARGYSLDLVLSQHDINKPHVLKALLESDIAGLLLFTAPSTAAFQALSAKIPHIVGVNTPVPEIDNVGYDTYDAGLKAMNYLVENGHTKIAFIGGFIDKDKKPRRERYDAYRAMMNSMGYPIEPEWIIESEWNAQTCYAKTKQLVQSDKRPTAVFVASDNMAMACMSAITRLGLKIPDDISVIGISDVKESCFFSPRLTTVAVSQKNLGECAAETLIRRITGDKTVAKQIYVPTKLIVRDSVKKI